MAGPSASQMPELLENADEKLSTRMRRLLDFLWQEWEGLQSQIEIFRNKSHPTRHFVDVSNRTNSSDTSLSPVGCARTYCIYRFLNALK
jgi:hypothetical protein